VVSKTAGQLDPIFVDKQNAEARTQLRGLQQRLVFALSLSERPPVIEQERITGLLPSEGLFESPARAKAVFGTLRDTLIRQRDADAGYINSGNASATETPKLRSRVYELDQIIRELDQGLSPQAAAPSAAPSGAPSGASGSITIDRDGNIIR
jgi:hypothetical protein